MDIRFRPKSFRQGAQIVVLHGKQLDAGITASATTTVRVATPYRKLYILRLAAQAQTLPIGGSSIFAVPAKNVAAQVVLSANFDLTVSNMTASVVKEMPLLSTLTDANRVVNEGDILYVNVVALGTVTTQPVGLIFTFECAVLE